MVVNRPAGPSPTFVDPVETGNAKMLTFSTSPLLVSVRTQNSTAALDVFDGAQSSSKLGDRAIVDAATAGAADFSGSVLHATTPRANRSKIGCFMANYIR